MAAKASAPAPGGTGTIIVVTGSAGHLGEALMGVLRSSNRSTLGIDIKPSPYTDLVGSICDREFLEGAFRRGSRSVIHAAASHKPHVVTHSHEESSLKLRPTTALRASCSPARGRFFPEDDDNASVRNRFSLDDAQLNELLCRRGRESS
jgi:hypothetical protein